MSRSFDWILNYKHGEKERSDKDKIFNELNIVDAHPINVINTGKKPSKHGKVVVKLQESANKEDLSSCIKETNEVLNDKNNSAITVENSQHLLLGQFKASDYNTSQKGFAGNNLNSEINNSVIPSTESDIRRNTNNSMSAKSSLQTRNKVVNPYLNRNDSDSRSISSLPQVKNKNIH